MNWSWALDLECPIGHELVMERPIGFAALGECARLYLRINPILEKCQPNDQFGFRKDRRIDDVLGIFENMVGKTSEWNLPIWIASLDLRKAFDRILHQPLFETLHHQEVPEGYVHLLAVLYKN